MIHSVSFPLSCFLVISLTGVGFNDVHKLIASQQSVYTYSGDYLLTHTHTYHHHHPLLQLWDVSAGKIFRRMSSHQGRVTSLSWNPTTSLLGSGARSGYIHNYDTRTPNFHQQSIKAHSGDIYGLQYSPSGSFLASSGIDKVKIWDMRSVSSVFLPSQVFPTPSATVNKVGVVQMNVGVVLSVGLVQRRVGVVYMWVGVVRVGVV